MAGRTSSIRSSGQYIDPIIGALPVQAVDTALVMKIIEPIWHDKPETASRLRGRIESVLNWATAREFRIGDNPARWRGHLDKLLPAIGKVRKVKHHPALNYAEISAFMSELRKQDILSAFALHLLILTAARSGEVLGARWSEIDLTSKLWTIPPERMKGGREHRIPLSGAAIELLEPLRLIRQGDHVFPGRKSGRALSGMVLLEVLRRMGRTDITPHGFRSSFRDWAAERTNFPNEVVEMALAHAVGNKVEAAYRRGDMFEKRRRLMDAWAEFCGTPTATEDGNVIAMRGSQIPA
jgi:integrase